MTDKNGRKLFDGDICEIQSSYIDEEDGYFVIEWDDCSVKFVLSGESLEVGLGEYHGYELEVLGNIFDNHKLMK